MSDVAHSKDLVCSEGTLSHYALQSLLYLYAWLLLVIVLRLCRPTQAKFRPDPNPKFCDFPNLEARILPKLRIFFVKLFFCDQNFSNTMQLHTVQKGDYITFLFPFT